MTRDELKATIRELYFYFRLKEPANTDQVNSWSNDLAFISSRSIDFIKSEMKNLDNLPRNIPKTIKSLHAQWMRVNSKNKFIKYDSYDDPRYPIEYLHQATELYIDKGHDAFLYYCKTNYMPSQDVERCENKVNCLIDRGAVDEMISKIGIQLPKTDKSNAAREKRISELKKQGQGIEGMTDE